MKTTQKPLNLEKLETILTKALARESLDIISIIVNCIMTEDKITILLQHCPPVSSFSDEIFRILKNILNQQYFKQSYQFNLSLAIYGEKPYAFDTFTNIPQPKKTTQKRKQTKINSKNRYFWLLFGSSILSLSIIYIFTQPCVVGKCEPIIQAQELATNSEQLIREEDLLEAEVKLNTTLKLLQSIPWFSSYYSEAQQLINHYQNTFQNLPIILREIQTANQAIIASQKTTISLQELKSIQETLQKVINSLKTISQTPTFETIAKNSQEIYQIELEKIKNIYDQENKAENDILTASEMANIAAIRQEQSYSLKEWQLVNTTWLLVTDRLKSIKPENIAYPQAQKLLIEYQPIIKEAENKLEQEKKANQTYQEAIKIAQQAKRLANQRQYSLALKNWKNSLNILTKINQKTSKFNEAQNLITNYQIYLKNTEEQLKFAQTRQKANLDLDSICFNQEKICTYTLQQDNIIKVYLNSQYLQKVLQIAMSNQLQGNLLQHISSVQKALEAISNKYKLPLEVYHSDGGLLFSYSP